jgi:hypothetical protein
MGFMTSNVGSAPGSKLGAEERIWEGLGCNNQVKVGGESRGLFTTNIELQVHFYSLPMMQMGEW